MNIELSKKNIGTGMALFALAVSFVDPILGFFFLILAAFVFLFWHKHEELGNLDHFAEIHSAHKLENIRRVLALAHTHGEITNDQVEKTLGVSNSTAERYLNELEKRGHLVQVGTTGRGVKYKVVG